MSIFKKQKETETTTSELSDTRTNYFYLIVFGIILIFSFISRFYDNGKKEQNKQEETPIENVEDISLLKSLESNNFNLKFLMFIDNDITEFIIGREKLNKEIVSKTYRENNNNYYINESKVYKISNNDDISLVDVDVYDEINKLFLNIEVLNKLIENKTYELDLKEEEYDIKRYKIEISRVINLYNEFNTKDINKSVSGEVIFDIYYKSEKLKGAKLDLTSLYKNLDFDYEKVIYYYEFSDFNNINIQSIITPIAE